MIVRVHLIPNASRNEIVGRTGDGGYRVKVQSPPVEGAANKNLLRFIAAAVGVSKSKVRIVSGEKSRVKTIEIDGDEKMIAKYLKGKT